MLQDSYPSARRAAQNLLAARRYHRPERVAAAAAVAGVAALTWPTLTLLAAATTLYAAALWAHQARVTQRVAPEVAALVAAYGPRTAAAVCASPPHWWRQVPAGLDAATGFAFLVAVRRVRDTATDCRDGHGPLCRHKSPAAPEGPLGGTWVAAALALPAEVGLLGLLGPAGGTGPQQPQQ